MELELDTTPKGIRQLLDFLSGGFTGGTDVDKPLELSLKRLSDVGWTQVGCLSMWGGAWAESSVAAPVPLTQPGRARPAALESGKAPCDWCRESL